MGLKLSVWMSGMTDDGPASSSSAFQTLAAPTSSRLSVMLHSSPIGSGDTRSNWSTTHCSPHYLISSCRDEVTRTPVEQSSDGVRAEKGVDSGLHLWELLWSPAQRGSHAVVGVSSTNCPLQASGYNALLGGDPQSWGWELGTNQLWHAGQSLGRYPEGNTKTQHTGGGRTENGLTVPGLVVQIPERVLLVLDADAGTLGYVVDGCFLGNAFQDLPLGVKLFPAVSSVRGGATIRLRYLSGAMRVSVIIHSKQFQEPVSSLEWEWECPPRCMVDRSAYKPTGDDDAGDPPALMALCSLTIRRSLGPQRKNLTNALPLPPTLQQYLLPDQ